MTMEVKKPRSRQHKGPKPETIKRILNAIESLSRRGLPLTRERITRSAHLSVCAIYHTLPYMYKHGLISFMPGREPVYTGPPLTVAQLSQRLDALRAWTATLDRHPSEWELAEFLDRLDAMT